MQADRERFGARRGLRPDAFGQGQALRDGMGDPGAEEAVLVRHPQGGAVEAHVETVSLEARAAEFAGAAGPGGAERDELARVQAGAVRRGLDHAGSLVAEDDRLADPDRAEAAVVVVVQVRAADAAAGDADDGGVGGCLRIGQILDPQVMGRIEAAGEIAHVTCPSGKAGRC